MHAVRNVQYVSGHRLLMTFEDARTRMVDLAPHLDGEIFEPLKDLEYFKRVRVSEDLETIVWDNGADFSPDFLYEIGIDVPKAAGVR